VPSQSRLTFERHLLKDVKLLIAAHRALPPKKGRPPSVYTRSGVFLLSAAFELYVEEMACESVDHLLTWANAPSKLPQPVQATLAAAIRKRDELFALGLAGTGWKKILADLVRADADSLNTPSTSRISDLFVRYLGVDLMPLLGPNSQRIGDFTKRRGEIAHKGNKAGHVSIKNLDSDFAFICTLVTEMDNFVIAPLKGIMGYQPWHRRA
jgi:hypothetical protein